MRSEGYSKAAGGFVLKFLNHLASDQKFEAFQGTLTVDLVMKRFHLVDSAAHSLNPGTGRDFLQKHLFGAEESVSQILAHHCVAFIDAHCRKQLNSGMTHAGRQSKDNAKLCHGSVLAARSGTCCKSPLYRPHDRRLRTRPSQHHTTVACAHDRLSTTRPPLAHTTVACAHDLLSTTRLLIAHTTV